MTDTQARLKAINEKLLAEHARLYDATGKGIVVIWIAACVFLSAAVMEGKLRTDDRTNQEQVTIWQR